MKAPIFICCQPCMSGEGGNDISFGSEISDRPDLDGRHVRRFVTNYRGEDRLTRIGLQISSGRFCRP